MVGGLCFASISVGDGQTKGRMVLAEEEGIVSW